MKAPVEARRLYDVTVLGVTATMPGPPDIVAMYRKVRDAYPPRLSVEIKSLEDHSSRRMDKGHSHHGDD